VNARILNTIASIVKTLILSLLISKTHNKMVLNAILKRLIDCQYLLLPVIDLEKILIKDKSVSLFILDLKFITNSL